MLYLSTPDVKRAIGMDPAVADADKDALVAQVGEAACRAVEMFIGRWVKSRAALEVYDGPGTSVLLLQHPPAVVTDVRIDATRAFGTDTIVDATTYRVVSAPEDGTSGGRYLQRYDGEVWTEGVGNIRVTYVGGWDHALDAGETDWTTTTVPRDLYQAGLLTAKSMWDKIGGAGPTGGKGLLGVQSLQPPGGGNLTVPSSLFDSMPQEAKSLASPYRWNVRDRVW